MPIIAGITIALILKAVAAVEIASVIVTLFLNFTQIVDWFNARRTNIPAIDRTKLSFTLMERLSAGDYKVVQGVFDERAHRLGDVRAIKARRIDAQLAGFHRHHGLVVYP